MRYLTEPDEFRVAAICNRGHVANPGIRTGQMVAQRCEDCGAKVWVMCPDCKVPLRGLGPRGIPASYTPPDFCWYCGEAFPWASPQARLYAIQNLLDEQPELDAGDRRVLEEQLSSLLEAATDTKVSKRQERAMEALRTRLAPALWERALPIASALLTAEIKAKLGLPQ